MSALAAFGGGSVQGHILGCTDHRAAGGVRTSQQP